MEAYSTILLEHAKTAGEQADDSAKTVFRFIGSICSMGLNADSLDAPFVPMMTTHEYRTMIVDDLTAEHLTLLSEIAPITRDADLRSRLADVVWVARRDVEMLRLAVHSYLESAVILENPTEWSAARTRIERALRLATFLGKSGEDLLSLVVSHIEAVLDKYQGKDGSFMTPALLELLELSHRGEPSKYAKLADVAAHAAEEVRDWRRARANWEQMARWSVRAGARSDERRARMNAAETYVHEARDALTGKSASYMVASTHIAAAIKEFRQIPKTKERRTALHRELLKYQKGISSELRRVSHESDVSELVEEARLDVKGLSLQEALLVLAVDPDVPKVSNLKSLVEELSAKHPLNYIMTNRAVDQAGKTIVSIPPILTDNETDRAAALTAHMHRHASMHRQGVVVCAIEPRRYQILTEHNPSLRDFQELTVGNPIFPPGRERLVALGLWHGMHGRFSESIHLLLPQFENSLRYVLGSNGVIVSQLSQLGVQEEYDLNRLMFLPEINNLFDEDYLFNIQGLLVVRYGDNLRNRIAHGLMSFSEVLDPARHILLVDHAQTVLLEQTYKCCEFE